MKKLTLAIIAACLPLGSMCVNADTNSFIIIESGTMLSADLNKKVTAAAGKITKTFPKLGIAVAESANPKFANSISNVSYVIPNLKVSWLPMTENQGQLLNSSAVPPNAPSRGNDDAYFDFQWGLQAVDAPAAWRAKQSGRGVRVAVLDTGIDADHPDLKPNLNTQLSRSFVSGEDWNIPSGVYFDHGTHVAGIIGAADNGYGVIGVAPNVELVAVKVISSNGMGSFADAIAGIIYAADIKADVINLSLEANVHKNGSSGISAKEVAALSHAMSRAIAYADKAGSVVIAAAGNSSIDKDHTADLITLPADLPHVNAISATAPYGWASKDWDRKYTALASYSNYGRSAIAFGAPGGDFDYPSFVCTVAGVRGACTVFDMVVSTISEGFAWAAGTSMAAPHAAGVAAIIIGENGGDMKPAQVIAKLKQRALRQGNSAATGAGLVNTGY